MEDGPGTTDGISGSRHRRKQPPHELRPLVMRTAPVATAVPRRRCWCRRAPSASELAGPHRNEEAVGVEKARAVELVAHDFEMLPHQREQVRSAVLVHVLGGIGMLRLGRPVLELVLGLVRHPLEQAQRAAHVVHTLQQVELPARLEDTGHLAEVRPRDSGNDRGQPTP